MRAARPLSAALLVLGLGCWAGRAFFLDPTRSAVTDRAAPPPAERTPVVVAGAESIRTAPPPLLQTARARLRSQVAEIAAEFDRLRALPDDIENLRASAELENEYAALLAAAPETAAMLVREMPAGFVDSHFGVIALHRWASSVRVEAAAWMAAHPGTGPAAAEALARGWLDEDAAGAEAHLTGLPDGPSKNHLALTVSEDAFIAKKPEQALALLDHAMPGDGRRGQLAEWSTTAWAIRDAEAAAAWAGRETNPERRQALLAAVVIGEANRDPAAAAKRLFATVDDPAAQATAVHALARLWAVRDPEAAARWLNALPAGALRESAEEGLLAIDDL